MKVTSIISLTYSSSSSASLESVETLSSVEVTFMGALVVVLFEKVTLVRLISVDLSSALSSLIVLFESNVKVVLISLFRLPKEGSDLPDPD